MRKNRFTSLLLALAVGAGIFSFGVAGVPPLTSSDATDGETPGAAIGDMQNGEKREMAEEMQNEDGHAAAGETRGEDKISTPLAVIVCTLAAGATVVAVCCFLPMRAKGRGE